MPPARLIRAVIVTVTLLPGLAPAAGSRDALDDTCWEESFDEPFDSLSLYDEATGEGRWKPAYIWGEDIIINEEEQFYIDPRVYRYEPFEIDDGVLAIVAAPTPAPLKAAVENQPYVSGVLTTEESFSQRHGRFEVRAKVPAGQGLWSAFWLLPSFDAWPEGVDILPEIDVMEHIGHEPEVYHTTLHTNQNGKLESHPYDHTLDEPLTDDFHVYSVVWTEDEVRWYLDGRWMAANPTPDDYTRPVHFLLNLAVGGTWPGTPDATTDFPARFLIDYVKAYEPADTASCTES